MTNAEIIAGAQNLCHGVPFEKVAQPSPGETRDDAFLRAKASEVYLKFMTSEKPVQS